MPLRDLILDDDDDYCERRVTGLLSAIKDIAKWSDPQVIDHFDALEIVRDRLSELLDKAEGK